MNFNRHQSRLLQVRNRFDDTNFSLLSMLDNNENKLLVKHEKIITDPYLHLIEFPEIKEYLGEVFNDITTLLTQFNVEVDDKVQSKYNIIGNDVLYKLFDIDFPEHEQIPRVMEIEIESDNKGRSTTRINGAKFGDPLRDNNYEDDGYRFHDIFHIAHAAVLGWSPTLRGLLRRKRKSNSEIDDVEDGGRAIVIEEGITAMIFNNAKDHNFFYNIYEVDSDLIRIIRNITSHLEVNVRNVYDWQRAILEGYDIWRYVRSTGNGRIIADLNTRIIKLL